MSAFSRLGADSTAGGREPLPFPGEMALNSGDH